MLCTDKGGKITAKVNKCLTGFVVGAVGGLPLLQRERQMKTLVNKNNPAIRITAPEIVLTVNKEEYWIAGIPQIPRTYLAKDWTLVEEEPKHTEVWVEGRTIFEQEGEPTEEIKGNLEEIPSNVDLEKAAEAYADKHGFRVPYDGSNKFYDDVDVKASLEGFKAGAEWQKKQFSDILDKWEEHAIRGMKVGAYAYHQGKIALICDLRDWIKEQTKKQ